jgi:integrase
MGRKRMASRRGFPPNLQMNPNGYYYFVNPKNGKKKGIGRDKQDAFSQARRANAVLASMEQSDLVDWISGVERHTLKTWVPEYQKLWIEKSNPTEGTKRNHIRYLERISEASFSWMLMKDITTAHIAEFVDQMAEESGNTSAKLIRSRFQDVFRMAATRGIIETGKNPVQETYKPATRTLRERMTLEQFILIRDAAPKWVVNAMNIAIVTGQRRGDITKMKFTDYVNGELQVIQAKGQGRVRIKIAGSLRLNAVGFSVEEVIKQCRDDVVSAYMVHHYKSRGGGVAGSQVTENGLSTTFSDVRDAVGIKAAEGRTPPTFHEIRSLSERLYRVERGAEFTQKLLGHANADMTSEYDNLRGTGWESVG